MAHHAPARSDRTRRRAGDTLSACPRPFAAWLRNPSPRTVDVARDAAGRRADVLGAVDRRRRQPGPPAAGVVFGLAAALPLLVRRRWPFAVLAIIVAVAVARAGRRAVRAAADGRALHDRRAPLVGGDDRRRPAPSWRTALVYARRRRHRASPPATSIGARARCARRRPAIGLYVGSKRTSIDAAARARRAAGPRARAARRARRRRGARADRPGAARRRRPQRQPDRRPGAGARRDGRRRARAPRRPTGSPTSAAGRWPRCTARCKLLRAPATTPRSSRRSPASATSTSCSSGRAPPGVGVELAVEGAPRALAQSVDLSAFRIVQEALTNVVKHAGRAHATVTLGLRPRGARADDRRQRQRRARRGPRGARAATAWSACASAPRCSAAR